MIISVSFWFFLAIVVLAPLPYGSAHIWSSNLLSVLTGVALLLWTIAAAIREEAYAIRAIRYGLPAALMAIVLVWIFVQASSVVPASLHHPVWAEVRTALGNENIRGSISLDPNGTLLTLTRISTYAAVFWLEMQYCQSERRAHIVFWAIAIAGFFYAAYGISAFLSGSGKILFADKWAYQLSLTSTFVNRNHYAVFAGMGLVTSFALTIRYLKRDASGAFDNSRRFLNSVENLSVPVFVLAGICLVTGSALLLTQSRGGVAFTALALGVFIMMLNAGGGIRKRTSLGLIGALIAGGVVMFAISGDRLTSRLVGKSFQSGRDLIHDVAIDAIMDAPVTGHGAGTFPALFHIYRNADFLPISPAFSAAHSVYLEFAAETGLIAAIIYFGMQLLIVIRCFIGTMTRRRHQVYPAAGFAVAVLVGFHSYFDFGPQIPGVAVTFAALLGVAFAQSWPSGNDRGRVQSGDR